MSSQIPISGSGGGSGVAGPGSSTDNAVVTWNSTAGDTLRDSTLIYSAYSLKGLDNTAGGAGAATDLTITASQKTSGTGAGGNLVLSSGPSFGGPTAKIKLRVDGTAEGIDLAYSATTAGGSFQSTGFGTLTRPTYSWAGATNSGLMYYGGPALIAGGTYVLLASVSSGQANIQSGTADGSFIPFSGNAGGFGYYNSTTLLPFNKAYFGTGVVGIGVASGATSQYSANALLDVQSTTKGVLFPRMTTTQKNAVTASEGMIVYDLTLHKLAVYTGSAWETVTSI